MPAAFVAFTIVHQALAQVTIVVAPGNTREFHAWPSVHVATTHPNCHVSVYTEANEQGAVAGRLSTASEGTIEAANDDAAWLSYGIFCP
ncbi:hypothetical protein B0H16DRAFT_1733083 [Mycena metata]|uniref:Uncharacterized protein n=1 Tax=Mycena metata TaxID=1033252 RepID=A0AAD7I190_9AGAR|nr:hypothetical protein B0H16DRAFT_1733083 [Mycena metata]